MRDFKYDLHIHSCLSPCAENDMTPANIAGLASLLGLEIVALTDHNTCRNCPAFFRAAKRCGIVPVAGMELTTAEDIHVICLFETLEDALAFDAEVSARRIRIANRPEIFGEQLIMDEDDNVIGTEPDLLINATDLDLYSAHGLCEKYGGVCYPAHIDRDSMSVLAALGEIPESLGFQTVEIADPEKFFSGGKNASYAERYHILTCSDAHRPEALLPDAAHALHQPECTFEALRTVLTAPK